jgi:D-amino-acid dehydrogenase
MKHIAVIGAGITGVMAAYYLAKEGYSVTVYDHESGPARKTSYANGGQISVSNSEVWNTWANIYKGFKWLGKKDAPLLIRSDFDIDKYIWLFKFLWHTVKFDYRKNTVDSIRLGLESRLLYKELELQENIEYDQLACGILHFYSDSRYFEGAKRSKKIYNDNLCEWDIIDPKGVIDTEPSLSKRNDIVGGAWTPSDYSGDIYKFCVELCEILKNKYKVKFVFDQLIDDLKDFENYDIVVVSAGTGSNKLAKSIGDRLPIYPVKGYSITIELDEQSAKFAPTVSLLDDQAKIVASRLGNRLRVAGTAELAGENWEVNADRIQPLLDWTKKNFPDIKLDNYNSWACLRPMTPNMMPIVKRSRRNSKIYYHTGHGHLGWTYSPATAKKLCRLINENDND